MTSGVPCFAPDSLVRLAGGAQCPVALVRAGDLVWTPGGPAQVRCVVKTLCPEGQTSLCNLPVLCFLLQGGLRITPYHPVRVAGLWSFPCDLSPATTQACPAVYSFLLTSGHILSINDVECAGLAHGFTDSPVIAHPYFGTQVVLPVTQGHRAGPGSMLWLC